MIATDDSPRRISSVDLLLGLGLVGWMLAYVWVWDAVRRLAE